jgi:2-polyprenyl-6-methoxyphenol hydroxylase-like FAD-dependent oxidoreductase
MSRLSSDVIRKRKIISSPDVQGSANCAYDESIYSGEQRSTTLPQNRSISCLISESLLMKNNSKCFKCVRNLKEGDDRVTVEFANCQIEKGDFFIGAAGIHSLVPALKERQQVLQYCPAALIQLSVRPRHPHW